MLNRHLEVFCYSAQRHRHGFVLRLCSRFEQCAGTDSAWLSSGLRGVSAIMRFHKR